MAIILSKTSSSREAKQQQTSPKITPVSLKTYSEE